MNKLIKVCFIFLLLTYYVAESSPISDNLLYSKSRRDAEEGDDDKDNDAEDDDEKSEENKSEEEVTVTKEEDDDDDNKDDKKDEESFTESSESKEGQDGTKLLIILADGVRHDYINRDKTLKGFPRIASNGVRAEYVKPVFPANSYPNWYSIATGRYPETHGIIENYMYNKEREQFFLMAPHPNASFSQWWEKSEPIWITAEKNGVKAALYLWDGCQVKIRGKRPSVCVEYKALYDGPTSSNETRWYLEKVLEDFKADKYKLAQVYYEFIDYNGHYFGPRSRKTRQAVREFDDILYDLQDHIIKRKMQNEINVIIVSDHGMIQVKEDNNIVELEDILDFNDVDVILGGGSIVQILPEDNKEDEVYKQLRQAKIQGLNIYKKEKIPKRFHFKNNNLVLPILITADEGTVIKLPKISGKVYPDRDPEEAPLKGIHGYDPDHVEEMRTVMYAFGPAFRSNYVSKPLSQVDHYNLFCHVLDIKPKSNNGTWSHVEKLLKDSESDESSSEESDEDESDESDESGEDDEDDGAVIHGLHYLLYHIVIFKVIYLMSCNSM